MTVVRFAFPRNSRARVLFEGSFRSLVLGLAHAALSLLGGATGIHPPGDGPAARSQVRAVIENASITLLRACFLSGGSVPRRGAAGKVRAASGSPRSRAPSGRWTPYLRAPFLPGGTAAEQVCGVDIN